MLQQNNNNNYPCLNGLDSTPEMLQKCSRTSLPFSRALELGLADLPLIRGLRAWALCSKNRRKAAGVLGGGQAPIASPAGLRSSSACPRPADVYLSREGGHMAYGLPFGPEAGQAGIRALVTVASLKTSEGSGKTQTQCLFLQTEKGSCLYSAGKPVFGSPIPASSVVGGWLKGKIGAAGCRETPVRQRDQVPTPVAESGGNHVGVRSGRRWRKSCNAARKKKKGGSRDGQQSWREDPAPENTLDERQEEQNNGGLEGKRFPSPQRIRRLGQEKLEVSQSPSCCHETSSSGRIHCGGDSPRGSASSSPSTQLPRKRDEDERIIYALDSTVSALRSVSDLESYKFYPESCSSSDITELIDAKSEEELDTQNDGCSEKEETESEEFLVVSSCGEDVLVCNPSLYRAELSLRNYSVVPKSLVPSERENGKEGLNKSEQAVAECQSRGEEELAGAVQDKTAAGTSEPLCLFEGHENSRLRDDSDVSIEAILETGGTVTAANCCNCSPSGSSGAEQQGEATWEKKEDDLQEGISEQREIPEKGGEDGVRDYTVGDSKDNGLQKDSCKDVRENCALKLRVSAEQCRMNEETPETFAQTSRNQVGANSEISANVSHAAYTDLSTSLTHSRANPAHILPLSDSMATDRPLLEVEKEEEEEQVGLLLKGGSQEGESSHRRELEEPSEEEERGFAVAPQKGSKDEDEDEEDDFGVFMQAEGDSAWSEGLTMPASVPCESSKSVGECCVFSCLWVSPDVSPLLLFLFIALNWSPRSLLFILLANHLSPSSG